MSNLHGTCKFDMFASSFLGARACQICMLHANLTCLRVLFLGVRACQICMLHANLTSCLK